MNPKHLAAILAALAIGYAALWSSLGFEAKRSVVDALENLREKGVAVEYSSPSLGGFPYRMEITLEKLDLHAPRYGYSAMVKDTKFIGHVWKQDHWFLQTGTVQAALLDERLFVDSPSTITSIRFAEDNSLNLGIDLSSATLFGTLTNGAELIGDQIEVYVTLNDIQSGNNVGLMETERFKSFLRLGNLRARSGGSALRKGEIDLSWHGLGLNRYSEDAIVTWRDSGGTLEVNRLSLLWKTDEIYANMSLSLDENFYPLGAGTLKLKGKALEHLEVIGLIDNVPVEIGDEPFISAQFGRLEIDGTTIVALPKIKP